MVNFVRSKLIEKYKTSWADSLSENRNGHIGKLRKYSLYKHRLCREPYLKYINDKEERRCYTHLRISCHKLENEVGRYKKISAESRFCHICKSVKVGDEIHFITECHVFTDERNMLFYNISKVCKNCNLLSHQKFKWLFSNENTDVIRMFSQFIYNSHCKRFKIALSRK